MNNDAARTALRTAPGWYKASASQGQNGCVEINTTLTASGIVGVRDSKLGDASPILVFSPAGLALLATARAGGLDGNQ
jgi:hypothetical protein